MARRLAVRMSASAWGISNDLDRSSRLRRTRRSIARSRVSPSGGPSSSTVGSASDPKGDAGATGRCAGPTTAWGIGAVGRSIVDGLGASRVARPDRPWSTASPAPGLSPSGLPPVPRRGPEPGFPRPGFGGRSRRSRPLTPRVGAGQDHRGQEDGSDDPGEHWAALRASGHGDPSRPDSVIDRLAGASRVSQSLLWGGRITQPTNQTPGAYRAAIARAVRSPSTAALMIPPA